MNGEVRDKRERPNLLRNWRPSECKIWIILGSNAHHSNKKQRKKVRKEKKEKREEGEENLLNMRTQNTSLRMKSCRKGNC